MTTTLNQDTISFSEIAEATGTTPAHVAGAISTGVLPSTADGSALRSGYEAALSAHGTEGLASAITDAGTKRSRFASTIIFALVGLSAVVAVASFVADRLV